jgi:hypothetical protein
LLDAFKRAASPDITIYESVEGVIHRTESLLAERDTRSFVPMMEKNLLLVTGDALLETVWQKYATAFNLSVERVGN